MVTTVRMRIVKRVPGSIRYAVWVLVVLASLDWALAYQRLGGGLSALTPGMTATGLLIILVFVVYLLPPLLVPAAAKLEDADRVKATGDVRTALVQALGGAALVGTLYFTAASLQESRQGQIADRFARAVTQIADDKLDVRVGGIYALGQVATDASEDRTPIAEILTSYLREHDLWQNSTPATPPGGLKAPLLPPLYLPPASPLPGDSQAAATALHQALQHSVDQRLDLHEVDLRGADLSGVHLEGADLQSTHLEEADLIGAHLEGANFHDAHLEGAFLESAHLKGTELYNAHLGQGTNLNNADLDEADLIGAELGGANLHGAHLKGADIRGADLEGADLDSADLTKAIIGNANLAHADLRNADLEWAVQEGGTSNTGTDLEGADLTGAHLTGADLSYVNVDGADLAGVTGLTRTQLQSTKGTPRNGPRAFSIECLADFRPPPHQTRMWC